MLLLWWGTSSSRLRLFYLTVGSYIFYGYWDWRFTFLMLASTAIDYFAGLKLSVVSIPRKRKLWLILSIIANLSLLGFFKYYDFLTGNLNSIIRVFSGHTQLLPLLNIVLPVGISFYTFQSMSYTIDIYREKTAPVDSFLTFAAFVSLFPQLVAGPIVRFTELDTQLRNLKKKSITSSSTWAYSFLSADWSRNFFLPICSLGA